MTNRKKESCPCGSGRPFDQCCGRKGEPAKKLKTIGIWGGILVVAGVLTAVALSFETEKTATVTPPATAGTPEPWEYNPITNQHWDPRPGHEHWHAGPPPDDPVAAMQGGATGGGTAGATPQPYEYDAINDRHWDPAHGHWHSGPPPQQQVP